MRLPFLLTALLVPCSAFANTFDGPYVGAQVGYEHFGIDDDFTGAGVLAGVSTSDDFSVSGANGGIYTGYGKRFGSFYVGAELEASLGTADDEATDSGISASVEHDYDLGASVRAGFLLTETTLLYGRIGVVQSDFSYDVEAPAIGFTQSGNESLTGFRLGLGAETALTEHLTGRLDWAYTAYEDADITYTFPAVGGIGTENLSPDSHTVRVGLAYNF